MGERHPVRPLDPSHHYPEQFGSRPTGPPNGNYDRRPRPSSDTSNLSDAQKVKAEYWADGPRSAFPPGHMVLFAEALSRMRQ